MPATAGVDGLLRRVDREGRPTTSRRCSRPCSSACRGSGRSSTPASSHKLGAVDRREEAARRLGAQASCARGQRASRSRRSRCRARSRCSTRSRNKLVISQAQARARLRSRARADLRRGADRARRARVLRQPRPADPRGLRPVRGHRPDVVQPAAARRSSAPSVRRCPASRCKIAEDGEILVTRPERVPRLLQGARGDRRDAEGRLAVLRRSRRVRRGRLPDDHRPQEGDHHHRRRQEHRAEEHRGRAQAVAARRRGGRDRRSPQVPDRAGHARRGGGAGSPRHGCRATAPRSARARSRRRSTRSTRRSRASSR